MSLELILIEIKYFVFSLSGGLDTLSCLIISHEYHSTSLIGFVGKSRSDSWYLKMHFLF